MNLTNASVSLKVFEHKCSGESSQTQADSLAQKEMPRSYEIGGAGPEAPTREKIFVR